MPRDNSIKKVLVIGSGPIVIGQAAEFDYAGTQACRSLKEEGIEVVLLNSNPATIMTDKDIADRVYIEPLTVEVVEQLIKKEKPDSVLPTLGGQAGLNLAMELEEAGFLKENGVRLIGTTSETIKKAEDRLEFKATMEKIGEPVAASLVVENVEDGLAFANEIGYPVVLRPAYTLGGSGGGIAHDPHQLVEILENGLRLSRVGEVLVERCIAGWKEIEYEVMRDGNGNCITVCNMENIDPVGVHTGDSIVVAPSQTLGDKEYQMLRTSALNIISELNITGGCNVQYALHPETFEYCVIEVNPRVSRSSALASKATGFPIAKAAAKLAVGYTLDEITNDITKATPACFEPTIDYCVVKVPRFAFEKFKGTDTTLSTRMKAVGEIMAIGRTFEEAFGKAMRSLENGRYGLGGDGKDSFDEDHFAELVGRPTEDRVFYVAEAFRRGWTVDQVFEANKIDRWFLNRIRDIVMVERAVAECALDELSAEDMLTAKQFGLSDDQIAYLTGSDELTVRARRKELGVVPVFKTVDTCAAEFESLTEYHYKTYELGNSEIRLSDKKRAMILGAGPNRIGQGIEFDYCCVHASYALHDAGYETIMVNCNPETVSTDYDTSDRLYFEPLTYEDVMDIVDVEQPDGVVVTLGGQTPLKLARALQDSGVHIMGTKPEAIDLAEDRDRFSEILDELSITYPAAGMASSFEEACQVADRIGFPLLVRPSYVLGGRGMVIAYDAQYLEKYMAEAARITPDHPVYLDRFLEGAIESDVDALCDGEDVYIGGVLEHIEEAGVHSGDSACCIPPFTLSEAQVSQLRNITRRLAKRLGVVGLINIQFAIKDAVVYVIEANPRASRTVPFVSKATGVPLAKLAARIMAGEKISSFGLPDDERRQTHFCVKEAVMPFGRFPGADVILGPEMKSTGEVMGIANNFPSAYAKTQAAASMELPTGGTCFVSVCDRDKRAILPLARDLSRMGFKLLCTEGTCRALTAASIPCEVIGRIGSEEPNIGTKIMDGKIDLVINTPFGQETRGDGYQLRTMCVRQNLCYVTTLAGAQAFVSAIENLREQNLPVIALQDLEQWEER